MFHTPIRQFNAATAGATRNQNLGPTPIHFTTALCYEVDAKADFRNVFAMGDDTLEENDCGRLHTHTHTRTHKHTHTHTHAHTHTQTRTCTNTRRPFNPLDKPLQPIDRHPFNQPPRSLSTPLRSPFNPPPTSLRPPFHPPSTPLRQAFEPPSNTFQSIHTAFRLPSVRALGCLGIVTSVSDVLAFKITF